MNNNSFKFITEDSNKIEPPVDFMKPSKLGDDIINNRVVIDKKRDVVIDDIPGGIPLNNMSANNEFVDINNVPTTETNEFVNVAPVSIEEPLMNIQEIVEVAPQIEELDIKQVDDVSETVNINDNVDVTPQGFAQVQVSVQSEAVPVVDVAPTVVDVPVNNVVSEVNNIVEPQVMEQPVSVSTPMLEQTVLTNESVIETPVVETPAVVPEQPEPQLVETPPVVPAPSVTPQITEQPNNFNEPVLGNTNLPYEEINSFDDQGSGGNYSEYKSKSNFVKPAIIIIGVLVLLFVGFIFLKPKDNNFKPGSGDDNNVSVSSAGTRTVMVYIIGSDLESKGGAATSDIDEMVRSKFNTEDLNVLVYAGGTKKWYNDQFKTTENAIYEVEGEKVTKLKSYSVKDMTDYKTLSEFIDYVYENYKTDLYSLILWDHGSGPMIGYGVDENYPKSDSMSLLDIDKALNNTKLIKDTKFEFIGFDACLMSSIEVANLLKEEANFLIASAEVEPGAGWDYSFLGSVNKDSSTIDIGKNIIDSYFEYYKGAKDYYSTFGYNFDPDLTLTMVDLNNINKAIVSLDNLFKDLDSNISVSSYSKFSRDISRTVTYGYSDNASLQVDLVDLVDFANGIDGYEGLIDKFKKDLSSSVVYHKSNINESYGISMYFPITTKKYFNQLDSLYKYSDVNVSSNYKKFLTRYVNIANGSKFVKSNVSTLIPNVTDTGISAKIPSDFASNYEKADYVVFRKVKDDGSYLPIYTSTDVTLNSDVISATVTNRIIRVCEVDGTNCVDSVAYESSRDENYITYSTAGVISRFKDTFDIDSVNITIRVDRKTNEAIITDIKPTPKEGEPIAKVTINLNEWEYLEFPRSSYFLYDEKGKKLDEWKKSGTMYGASVTIADGFKFFVMEFDPEDEYYYMFRIKDTQENYYETDLVKEKK